MIAALVLATTLAAPVPLAETVEEAIRGADRILVGTIEDVRMVEQVPSRMKKHDWPDQSIAVVTIAVEQSLLGGNLGDDRKVLLALPPSSVTSPSHLSSGARAVLFLKKEWNLTAWASIGTKSRLRPVVAGRPLYELVDRGFWHVDGDTVAPPVLGLAKDGETIRLDALLDSLRQRISELVPFLQANVVSTGWRPWRMQISRDGRWRAVGDEEGRLPEAENDALWSLLLGAELQALPEDIGSMPGPDTPSLLLRLQTSEGWKRVELHPEDDRVREGELAEHAKTFHRIWAALPGTEKPRFAVAKKPPFAVANKPHFAVAKKPPFDR